MVVVGGLLAAVGGSLLGRWAALTAGLPGAYRLSLVAALLVVTVAYAERLGERFDRAAYETDRGTGGRVADLASVGIAGLLGGAAGTAVARAVSLSPGITIVVVFGLGFLAGMGPFVARNHRYYEARE